MSGRRLVVEADGGSRGNPGPAAFGAVVCDAVTRQVLVEIGESIGVATNNVAEYHGLLAGLEAAHDIDATASVEARLDSKLVVEQMSGRWQVKHPDMKVLAKRAFAAFPPEQVTYTWVPREQNKHADRLANSALDGVPVRRVGRQWEEAEQPEEPVPGAPSQGWSSPDLGAPTTLLLTRHGETELTREKRFSGSGGADLPLTDAGKAQAEQLAARLASHADVVAVVTSPLLRARETADVVAAAIGVEVEVEDGLRECDFGAFEGLTFAEVGERLPDELAAWLASTRTAPPGGESFDAVHRRVQVARELVLGRHRHGTVVVVSHVTPIKSLVRQVLEAPGRSLFRMELQPASLTTIAYWDDGAGALQGFNDVSHLVAQSG